jgi:dihydroflavonol-4-reductase
MGSTKLKMALVTGASGFLGSHLARALLDKGYKVSILARKSSDLSRLKDLPLELKFGSLSDPESLKEAASGQDYIFHSAGLIAAKDRDEYFKGNVEGTRNLLDAVAMVCPNVKRFVYVSSLAAGGPSEGKIGNDEKKVPKPITFYGESKLAGEKLTLEYKDRIPVSIIRPPAIYGPSDKPTFNFFKFAKWGVIPVFGKEDTYLSITHVADVVHAMILIAENEKARGETFYVSDGEINSWLDIWKIMCEAAGKKGRVIRIPLGLFFFIARVSELFSKITGKPSMLNYHKAIDMTRNWSVDSSKIRNMLGFKEIYSLREGTRHTFKWYKNNDWL